MSWWRRQEQRYQVVAWLPAAVAWQPYGPFAERAVQFCGFPGFAGPMTDIAWAVPRRAFFCGGEAALS